MGLVRFYLFIHIYVFCMDQTELVKKYRNYLTDLEFEELKVYKEVWYFGQHASKNYNKPAPTANTTNLGYDDDNGNYKIVSGVISSYIK